MRWALSSQLAAAPRPVFQVLSRKPRCAGCVDSDTLGAALRVEGAVAPQACGRRNDISGFHALHRRCPPATPGWTSWKCCQSSFRHRTDGLLASNSCESASAHADIGMVQESNSEAFERTLPGEASGEWFAERDDDVPECFLLVCAMTWRWLSVGGEEINEGSYRTAASVVNYRVWGIGP